MIVKEKVKKILKVIAVILLIIFIAFIIDTAVVGLKTNEEIVVDNYINKTFASKDLKNQLRIVSTEKLLFVSSKKATYYEIIENEQNILLVNDGENVFAIKFLDDSTIYCEKTTQYMYLLSNTKEKEV